MEEIYNLLLKKSKEELIDIVHNLFSDRNYPVYTTPKNELAHFIANEYVNGPVLNNLFSSVSSNCLKGLTELMCIPTDFSIDPNYDSCEIFYNFGLIRKKYNNYYPTQLLAERLYLFNTQRDKYLNKELNWIGSCFHFANDFYGIYPLEAVFIMANNREEDMDKRTFLALAQQISSYALEAVAVSVDAYQPLETIIKANSLKEGERDFLFSAQANCDYVIPNKQTVDQYDSLGYIPNESLDSLFEFVKEEKGDEDFAQLFVLTVFETNRFSLNFEQYRNNLEALLLMVEFNDMERLEQLIHEIYFTSPALRCKGGIPQVNDIVGLMLDGISLTLKQVLHDLDSEKAMTFVKETFLDIDAKFHEYFGDEVKDVDLFKNLPLS